MAMNPLFLVGMPIILFLFSLLLLVPAAHAQNSTNTNLTIELHRHDLVQQQQQQQAQQPQQQQQQYPLATTLQPLRLQYNNNNNNNTAYAQNSTNTTATTTSTETSTNNILKQILEQQKLQIQLQQDNVNVLATKLDIIKAELERIQTLSTLSTPPTLPPLPLPPSSFNGTTCKEQNDAGVLITCPSGILPLPSRPLPPGLNPGCGIGADNSLCYIPGPPPAPLLPPTPPPIPPPFLARLPPDLGMGAATDCIYIYTGYGVLIFCPLN